MQRIYGATFRFSARSFRVAPAAWRSFATQPAAARGPPGLVGLTGAPITSQNPGGGKVDPSVGMEVELNSQNAMQVLQSKGAMLLQVGKHSEATLKKITKLRSAAAGRLPLVLLDCGKMPQICQSLQIKGDPCIFLMAQGQVAAAFEGDLSPQNATAFVESVGQLLGLQVDLSEGVAEQLQEAEELEWTDAKSAEAAFGAVLAAADLSQDARVRAAAGQARCALWNGRVDDFKEVVEELESGGHGRVPEVKQALSMLWLHERRSDESLEALTAAAEIAGVADFATAEPLAVATFWAGDPVGAFDVGIKLLRKNRAEEARKLVMHLVDVLGPRHPRYSKARKSFSNSLFV